MTIYQLVMAVQKTNLQHNAKISSN